MLTVTDDQDHTYSDDSAAPPPEGPHAPELDAEKVFLGALVHNTDRGVVAHSLAHVADDDLTTPVLRTILATIRHLVIEGRDHGPTRILATLTNAGQMGGHAGQQLGRALGDITTVTAHPEALHAYTGDVLSSALRRHFRTIAETNLEAAEHAPTDELFATYYNGGRTLRELENRIARHHNTPE